MSRGQELRLFEGDRALDLRTCSYRTLSGRLELLDARGAGLVLAEPGLVPEGAHLGRLQALGSLLGLERLLLLFAALLGALACLWLAERWRAREQWHRRVAGLAGLLAVFLAGVAALLVWWTRGGG